MPDGYYILNRGLLNIAANIGMPEDANGGAITNFYFSILNFVQRESKRRKATPYYHYVTHQNRSWSKLGKLNLPQN